jgi:hypothetical protein
MKKKTDKKRVVLKKGTRHLVKEAGVAMWPVSCEVSWIVDH